MELHAINALRPEWERRSRGPQAEALLRDLQAAEPDLRATGARTLRELFSYASGDLSSEAVARWDVTTALIRQFGASELVAVGLLAFFVRGLLTIATAFEWGRGLWADRETFAVDLVSTTWTVLAEVGGTTLEYPENSVLDRVRCRLRHQRDGFRREEGRLTHAARPGSGPYSSGGGDAFGEWDALVVDSVPDEHPISVLEELGRALGSLGQETVSRDDARLLFANRVMGYELSEIAAATGVKVEALKYRRRSAEAALLAS